MKGCVNTDILQPKCEMAAVTIKRAKKACGKLIGRCLAEISVN